MLLIEGVLITGDILRELRNSKKAKDAPRIYTAGEKEHESEVLRLKEGMSLSIRHLSL